MNNIEKIIIKKYNFICEDVPDGFVGTTIAFLADIHHGRAFPLRNLKSLIEMTNNLRPDMILLGGDYVDKDPDRIVTFFRQAAGFSAPLGVYGVLGNHDRKTDASLSIKCMTEAGITLLDNRALWIHRGGDKIRLGGVGDLTTGTQNLSPMLDGTSKEDLMILVTHHPDYAMQLPRDKIDLMLCGHTHGGQVSFFGKWIPPWPGAAKLKYLTGVVREGRTTIIISNGIGTVGPPIRIFATPQIWLIRLMKNT